MTVFFNGRLYTTPTTVSAVNDSALANQNSAQSNALAILGPSTGGQPNTALVFGTPSEAAAVLLSGDLLTAVQNAFSPSNQTGGPASVTAVRVNPAVQSTLVLDDSTSAASINLTSADWGQYTTGINVSIAAGSEEGLLVTVSLGEDYYTEDNITNELMQVSYSGAQASATMTINGTECILDAPAGTPVATISLASYPTVQALAGAISAVAGFSAVVEGSNGALPSVNGFDYITAQDVLTAPYIALGVLSAVVAWFNSSAQPLVTATRAANAGLPPAPISDTYLVGGSDGTITNTQYSNAYTLLQSQDVQWVVPATSSPSIHAMNDAHCQFMSTIGMSERRGICGMAIGTSDAEAIAEALSLNSDRTGLVHIGYYGYNAAGVLTLYGAYLSAAFVAGGFAGVSPGTPMTNKAINVKSLERVLTVPTETDALIDGGVIPLESTSTGYKVVQSISTWLVNSNFNRVEISTGAAVDYLSRSVRAALDPLRGQAGSPTVLSQAASITSTTLTALAVAPPTGPGVIVGDATNPAFKNIQASLMGNVIAVQFQASPCIPVNYVTVTIFAVPYSGSISVS